MSARPAAALVLLALALPAHADPLEVRSGGVVLPITGLQVDLPADARSGATWSLSGSWALSNGGHAFDGRDVVDLKVDGRLVAGNWIHVGWFEGGDCGRVVAGLDVTDRWTREQTLWGRTWSVAGGAWDFQNDLGKVPAVALCTTLPGHGQLLIYHFFLGVPLDLPAAALLNQLVHDPLLPRVAEGWATGATAPVLPGRHPEIHRRGDIPAARTTRLPRSGFDVAIPDDGVVWLVRDDPGATSDYLDRMAPSVPDLTLEVARVPGAACGDLFDWSSPDAPKRKEEPPPTHLPEGFRALATLVLDDGLLERVVCRDVGGRALVVGVLVTPSDAPEGRDLAPLGPLLGALAAGSDAASP